MKNLLKPIFLLCLIAIVITACKKEDTEIKFDPQKAILGKWQLTHTGFGPVNTPTEYEKYLPNGTLEIYNYQDHTFLYNDKYWFTDSLLYKQHIYLGSSINDTLLNDIQSYKYKFIDENTLQLDRQQLFMNSHAVYKRIE